MKPQAIIRRSIPEHMLVEGRSYPKPLPEDLEPWYCYLLDGGHSIAIITEQHYEPGIDPTRYLVPAPVKSVLRAGYEVSPEGLVVSDIPYSSEVGLLSGEDDDEF